MRDWSKGEKDWLFPRVLTSIAMTFAVVPRIHPRVNTTNYFSAFWKEGQRKPSRCTRKRTLILLRILAVLPVSRPGVPLAIILGSRPGAMERKPNCTAKCSDDLSEDGCKPVWTGDASKGYESGSKT